MKNVEMIIAANWKMNPSFEVAGSLATELSAQKFQPVKRILFAPHPYLLPISSRLKQGDIRLGGQDCHNDVAGAYTGDVSAAMLRDCGASIVLLGHSERRSNHGETSALVAAKARQAVAHGLDVMICLGETLGESRLRSFVPGAFADGSGSEKEIAEDGYYFGDEEDWMARRD